MLLGLMACSTASEPELLVPDVVSVNWSASYNEANDGLGAIVPIDVMVYDGASGEPMSGVSLQITTEHDGTWVLPSTAAVRGVHVDGRTGGDWLWDARHDRYVSLGLNAEDAAVGSSTFVTGADGVARAQVFVDQFPSARPDLVLGSGSGTFQDVALVISASSPDELLESTVLLQPR